jgi:hypothetical protein
LPGMVRMFALALAVAFLGGSVLAEDHAADLRARFQKEPNPVNKAKMLPQLGDVEFTEIDKDISSGDLKDALATLEQYRDQVQSCEKALDGSQVDAEKHPAGFKQLQFSLRGALRRLDILIVGMTSDDQLPFLACRKDLNEIDLHVIHELFPREPEGSGGSFRPQE